MHTGLLWFDNDPKTTLSVKIQKAMDYYRPSHNHYIGNRSIEFLGLRRIKILVAESRSEYIVRMLRFFDSSSALSQKFLMQFRRQSPQNRRSQVDPYCINTDQLAKPAVDRFQLAFMLELSQQFLLRTASSRRRPENKPFCDICCRYAPLLYSLFSEGIQYCTAPIL